MVALVEVTGRWRAEGEKRDFFTYMMADRVLPLLHVTVPETWTQILLVRGLELGA